MGDDGSFAYMPSANFSGVDAFTCCANDGGVDSNTATVQITVITYHTYLPLVFRNH